MSDAAPPAKRSRRSSGAVTLHDVARLAGVAPITASRALNTPAQVSAEVLRKVSEAVARTGYVPNRLAGGLASTRSRLVALVVPTVSGPVFLDTIQALTETLDAAGYQLMVGQAGYEGRREDALLEAIIGRRPDGIVLTGILHSDASRRRLLASGIPVVETWDLTPTPLDMLVGFSHQAVGEAVARYLHGRGRRRLATLSGDDPRATQRAQAFARAAEALGLPPVRAVVVKAPTTLQAGRGALTALMAEHDAPTTLPATRRGRGRMAGPPVDAVFCSSDLLALGLLTEARMQGLAVPDDLAVVGFGDLEMAAQAAPAISSVSVNGAGIGVQAARFLIERAEGRAVAERVVDIGFRLIERHSS
ncbi:LacI family DNA-binding transcriptional regulator [Aquabacterium sp. OR-4]|uniref:LacI family DNA-binding transcriptional regulator n=1 Tax=Aquabacterium sp. OR-4 TaxID=2978127 RepID=UPI0021B1D525|nr:LacI family DNA-binding transcriptional regulator [Aquabacterium sp. OR-4]MDT7838198.1 LacI family DNA-binding transcriptional regulator [Aquabacterium sp. OR-4]